MWKYTASLVQDLSPGVKRFIATESLFGIGAGIFSLILNLHLLALGFSEGVIGQITSLGALTVGITSLPASMIVRRVGRKRMLVLGITLACISLIVFGFGTSRGEITVAQIIWSLGVTAVVNSEIQLIFGYCRTKKEETSAYSLLFAIFTLFTGVGTMLGGFLPDLLGGSTTVYQNSFFVAAGCMGLMALLRGLLLPAGEEASREKAAAGAPEKSKSRHAFYFLLMLSVLIFSSGFKYGLVTPFLNVILKFRFDMNDGSISTLLAVCGVFFFIGSIIMPYIVERWGSRRTFIFTFVSNIVITGLMAVTMPAAAFAVLLMLRGTSTTMLDNHIDSESMSAVADEDRNLYAGMRTVSRSIGNTIASYWAGYILAGGHYSLPFLLTTGALLFGFVLYAWFVQGKLDQRLKQKELAATSP
ncbi:putative MFS family arabinose efflux permease [Paenibacillus taihuensis]|uniref:Putative MFS family arabinose efflux permease n=1 Tax=Paenibacillus taihuensis TaxID=1156355 RepID=A0A3D9SKY4_9BACL|nr:MFS transporter [Paenibacillus taihuensis]REE94563.1 putative MFS family arabinose efflux permease [Paenibacillus taihuensis]